MLPAEPVRFEAGEIRVAGDPGAPFGDREGGMLRVGHPLAGRTAGATQAHDILQVRCAGDADAAARMGSDLFDGGQGCWERCGRVEDPRVRHDADEAYGDEHTQAEGLDSVDQSLSQRL